MYALLPIASDDLGMQGKHRGKEELNSPQGRAGTAGIIPRRDTGILPPEGAREESTAGFPK
jgi:hypothetical protein